MRYEAMIENFPKYGEIVSETQQGLKSRLSRICNNLYCPQDVVGVRQTDGFTVTYRQLIRVNRLDKNGRFRYGKWEWC